MAECALSKVISETNKPTSFLGAPNVYKAKEMWNDLGRVVFDTSCNTARSSTKV
jgi:hypothetical protein